MFFRWASHPKIAQILELNGHFSKKGWTNIIAAFEKKTGKEYPRAKYKHKQDGLKKDWVIWNKLKGSETGLEWDVAKGTIAATDGGGRGS